MNHPARKTARPAAPSWRLPSRQRIANVARSASMLTSPKQIDEPGQVPLVEGPRRAERGLLDAVEGERQLGKVEAHVLHQDLHRQHGQEGQEMAPAASIDADVPDVRPKS